MCLIDFNLKIIKNERFKNYLSFLTSVFLTSVVLVTIFFSGIHFSR